MKQDLLIVICYSVVSFSFYPLFWMQNRSLSEYIVDVVTILQHEAPQGDRETNLSWGSLFSSTRHHSRTELSVPRATVWQLLIGTDRQIGIDTLYFYSSRIRTLVAMTTYIYYRLIMVKSGNWHLSCGCSCLCVCFFF